MTALRKIQDNHSESTSSEPGRIILLVSTGGQQEDTNTIYIRATWAVARSAFWLHAAFSRKEQRRIHTLLNGHFLNTRTSRHTFNELCQRIAIERLIATRCDSPVLQSPQTWLDIRNKKGLVNSNYHYRAIADVRRKNPTYLKELRWFALAMQAAVDAKPARLLKRYRSLLLKGGHLELLQLLYNSLVHFQNNL